MEKELEVSRDQALISLVARVLAVETLLIKKGVVSQEELGSELEESSRLLLDKIKESIDQND